MLAFRSSVLALSFVFGACVVGDVLPPSGGGTPDAGMGTQGGGTGSGGTGSGGTGTGSGSGTGGTGTGGGQTFKTQVAPLVSGCLGCHGGGQPPTLTSFMTLEAAYKVKPGAQNILVKKGAHEGPALAPASVTQIANWIDSLP